MKRKKNIVRVSMLAAALVALAAGPILAADALFICQSGVPFAYPTGGANILWNPDLGELGPLTNAQAVAAVDAAFDSWENVSTSSATFLQGSFVATDIDVGNFGPIYNGLLDGESPIVFDEDGSIFTTLFGPGSGILGFAGPEFGNVTTCELLEGSAWLNGPEFVDLIVAEDIMVHEFGHYVNLGHTELNGQLAIFSEGGDDSGPSPDNATFGTTLLDGTEVVDTMYPIYFSNIDQGTRTPHADDIASISTIYPDASFANRGSISGAILAPGGTTRLSGVNVIARNINDPFLDSVSTFSGAYTNSTSQADPNVGLYTLSGLTPGEKYAVFVDQVTAAPNRFSNPILGSLPGPEEFWNAGDESNDPATDDPLDYVLITASAGGDASGTDIIFNDPAPVIPLGDDDFAEIFLGFPYEICGQTFESVFVNSNGNLTFGSGDTDFTESAGEMLSDQPRIAALWDDLSPNAGGEVSFSRSTNSFSVRFEDVPEFLNTGANTFDITLHRASDVVDFVYGAISATDGLAGVSCGGAITSGFEIEADLTALQAEADLDGGRINLQWQPAVYEVFSGDNDLAGEMLLYNTTSNYNDSWAEPNDTLKFARNIRTPFDSTWVTRFTEIEPTGGDVDFYRFRARKGQTLIAEVVSGQLDSLIGVFDSDGVLLDFDDDGGAGLLSRIAVPIFDRGYYYLAVTTFADFGFTGAGGSGGRYVLSVDLIDGIQLDLGDDAFQEVALGFSFPFNGSSYTSVFVNSNGNLTFGSGDTDFSETEGEFLADQPRIAPLWDDLSPNSGGTVTVAASAGSATVSYVDVPEFLATGANTFSVTLSSDGSYSIDYGSVTAGDGIAGTSPGGGAAFGAVDLSAGGPFPAAGSTYEVFLAGFDLAFDSILFIP
jgi:hypothetical protein